MPINTVYHHLERAWQEDLHHLRTDAGNGNHPLLRVLLPPTPKRRLGAVWTTGKINENSPEHLHEKVNPDEIQFAMKSLISLRIPLPVPSSSWWVRFFTECLHKLFWGKIKYLGCTASPSLKTLGPGIWCLPVRVLPAIWRNWMRSTISRQDPVPWKSRREMTLWRWIVTWWCVGTGNSTS